VKITGEIWPSRWPQNYVCVYCLVLQARNDGFGMWELERELEAETNIQKMAGT